MDLHSQVHRQDEVKILVVCRGTENDEVAGALFLGESRRDLATVIIARCGRTAQPRIINLMDA